jgi:CubicO group peptidase (beta-lactamase class C family)
LRVGTKQRLERALAQIDSWIGADGVPGAAVVVRESGTEICAREAGEARPGVPVAADTLFGLASVTKPITAAAVMTLVDDGLISLEEPIARFVPEFAATAPEGNPQWEAARRLITVRQALAHLTGLPEDLPPGALRLRDLPDLATITDHLIGLPLQFEPGTALRYSNAGYALLGRVIERATGRDVWDYARERLLDPMGLKGIVARPGPAVTERVAHLTDASSPGTDHESYNSPYWRNLAMPWGGLFGTARDLATFAEAFTTGADLPLSVRARELMTEDHAGGVSGGLASLKLVWTPAHWGLGWEVKGSKRRHWTGDYTSPLTFCHWGAAGTLLWSDPAAKVTAAIFANRTTYNQWPFQPEARWSRLSNAILASQE